MPPICQHRLTNKALNGISYSTGTDQLELAIDLAENGASAEAILYRDTKDIKFLRLAREVQA